MRFLQRKLNNAKVIAIFVCALKDRVNPAIRITVLVKVLGNRFYYGLL